MTNPMVLPLFHFTYVMHTLEFTTDGAFLDAKDAAQHFSGMSNLSGTLGIPFRAISLADEHGNKFEPFTGKPRSAIG
jgi:hypothetical protein